MVLPWITQETPILLRAPPLEHSPSVKVVLEM
jgi:hypothetical protein